MREEEKRLVGTMEPLINYATFEDYIKIIFSEWDKFKKYFQERREEVSIPLKIINIYARRPIAHFRTLTKTRIEFARSAMNRFLSYIDKYI